MPKRSEGTIRVDASAVQGDGAYVVFKKFFWGERRSLQERLKDSLSRKKTGNGELIAGYVGSLETLILDRLVEWNWVDEQGERLPLPKTPDDLGKLLDDEIQFLFDRIQEHIRGALGSDAAAKN